MRFWQHGAECITELVIFGGEEEPMTGEALKAAREEAKLTQAEAAEKLGLTQAYFSMMERGLRPVTKKLAVKAVRVFRLSPTALPLKVDPQGALDEKGFKAELGALGYPGFAKFRVGKPKYNPARLLLLAIGQDTLDIGVVEALPWLVVKYVDLDWQWVLRNAKAFDGQNRLGFVVDVAEDLAKKLGDVERRSELREMKRMIEWSRLVREDTLCGESMGEAERKRLRRKRTAKARHWNLLTDVEG
jgi:transcriptional regulator with XRE-family HTH domain